jgi:hypothetical protein
MTEYVKLPPEFKTHWVAALRSGKYKQATDVLKSTSGGFCCLGVACDINGVEWETDYNPHIDYPRIQTVNGGVYMPYEEDLPEDVYSVLFQELIPRQDVYVAVYLSVMNDGGRSFSEIADWIEENL